jgi:cytochrome b
MVQVWDLFVRLFHWSVVALLAIAYLSADWRAVHLVSGYTICVLLAARLVWGVAGPRYAKFNSFIGKPAAVVDYARQAIAAREPRYLGHNPAGGVMVLLLLLLLAAASLSGVLLRTDIFWGSEEMQTFHGWLSTAILAFVPLHVAGVVFTGVRHGENLVWSMVTGRKRAPDGCDVT